MKHTMYMIIALCIPAYLVNNDYNHIHDYPKLVSPEEAVAFYDEYQKGHLPDTNVKVWKQPLIIDNANEEFKNKSIVQFNENVIFRPDPNYNYPYIYQGYRAAIIINKSDITIDLAGFTLALDPTSAPNFITNNPIYGIAIMPGVRNVTIKSATVKQPVQQGSIVGFSGYAIYALGESQTLNSYDPLQNFIKNLTIDNISISYNTSGIYIGYALLVDISNTDIVYNMSFRNGYGIYLYNVSQGEIRNARVNHNWAYNNSLGYCLENTVSMLIQKSQAKLNRSLKSGSAYGFTLLQSGSGTSYINEIMNCTSNANLASPVTFQESIGFLLAGNTNRNIISDCSSIFTGHTRGDTLISNFQGSGIKIMTDARNNQIHNNKIGYHWSYGIIDYAIHSTSFFTNNFSFFNQLANYHVYISNGAGASVPLSVLEFDQNTLSAYNNATPLLQNLSIVITANPNPTQ